MKNVFLIPTEKPSRLLCNHTLKSFCFQKEENGMFVNDGKVSGASFWSIEKAKNNGFNPQHIYITSDEKITSSKDWFIDIKDNRNHLHQVGYSLDSYEWIEQHNPQYFKKIILTTDQDLIKDGIQAIDDEFLQWYVKNPSCEYVEIVKCRGYLHLSYMIIIPQEEPKPIHQQIIEIVGGEDRFKEIAGIKPKQETLKKVEENIDREEWIHFFKNNSKEEILEYLIKYKFPL